MKLKIVCILLVSNIAYSQQINDKSEDVKAIFAAYKILGTELILPQHVDLKYNNDNGRLSPGEVVILTSPKVGIENFECKIQLFGGDFVSQTDFQKALGFSQESCLYKNSSDECFISRIKLNLTTLENKVLFAVNANTPPGTLISCASTFDPKNNFSSLVWF